MDFRWGAVLLGLVGCTEAGSQGMGADSGAVIEDCEPLPAVQVQPICADCAITLDWSGLRTDLQGNAFEPTAVSLLVIVRFGLPAEDALETLADCSLAQFEVTGYLEFFPVEGSTSYEVGDELFLGAGEEVSTGVQAWEGDTLRGWELIEPDPASQESVVEISN